MFWGEGRDGGKKTKYKFKKNQQQKKPHQTKHHKTLPK